MPRGKTESYARLYRLLRRAQRENRFVAGAAGTRLGLMETHLLVELDAFPEAGITEVAELLAIDKVAVSRLVAGLEAGKIIKTAPETTDRRRKRIQITAYGRGILDKIDRFYNESMERMCSRLDERERSRFHKFLKSLADGLNAPPSPRRSGDHFLRPDVRRVTRAFGLLGQSVFQAGSLSSVEWQMLSLAEEQSNCASPSALAESMNVPLNTLSGALARLQSRGLILRKQSEADRRRAIISLSSKAERILSQTEKEAVRQLENALSGMRTEELSDFAELFSIFAGEPVECVEIQPRLSVRELNNDDERAAARELLVLQALRENSLRELPETLYGARNRCLGLFNDTLLVAACEFPGNDDMTMATPVNVCRSSGLETSVASSFTAAAKKLAARHS